MMRRSNAVVSRSIAAAVVSLPTVASLRAGQRPADPPLVSEQHFKNVQLLKGMPVDTFFDVMGMFAASMGNDCTFCHVKEAGFRREALAETTPRIQRVNLYFDDESGLLVRVVRWNETSVGPVPTEINYCDYRAVAGVQMPFTWTATQTYMQMTIRLSDVAANVPVDASRFARPPEFRAVNR